MAVTIDRGGKVIFFIPRSFYISMEWVLQNGILFRAVNLQMSNELREKRVGTFIQFPYCRKMKGVNPSLPPKISDDTTTMRLLVIIRSYEKLGVPYLLSKDHHDQLLELVQKI